LVAEAGFEQRPTGYEPKRYTYSNLSKFKKIALNTVKIRLVAI